MLPFYRMSLPPVKSDGLLGWAHAVAIYSRNA